MTSIIILYPQKKNSYMLLNNILDHRIIIILDKYSPNIYDNVFLLFAYLMATKGLATEASAYIILTFQDIKFIKSYSKEKVGGYLNGVKKKI